jgi:hypothetical protein
LSANPPIFPAIVSSLARARDFFASLPFPSCDICDTKESAASPQRAGGVAAQERGRTGKHSLADAFFQLVQNFRRLIVEGR